MSAEPERVFSGSRPIIDWLSCRLSPTTIEKLERIKHWVKQGLDIEVEGEELEELSEPLSQVQEPEYAELTLENLGRHATQLAEAAELEPVPEDEIYAAKFIPREGQDDDSDVFNNDDSGNSENLGEE